jgi:thiol:disulfide interchange protein
MKRLAVAMVLLTFALLAGAPIPARALESAAVSSKRAVATIVTDTDAIQPGLPFRVGLRLRMSPVWHTYWKNPGDAGVPPELTIAGTTPSPIDWPTPHRIAEGSVMTYGYTGEVLLPVTVTAVAGALKAHAEWLVCNDICVPEDGDFTLTLPLGAPGPSPQAALFAAHERAVPRTVPWSASIAADGTLFVQAPELSTATVVDAWFIPDQPGAIQDNAPQMLSVRDRAGLQTDVAIDAPPGVPASQTLPPLGEILVLAFLGGLILNLMPCVFPILAMKAFALARHAGQGSGHALSYTAGVLVTFMVLAGALLVTRAAGTAAGWGFQFSSPIFVAAMTWLLFAVGLNLSGVFQVGAGLTGTGSGLASRHGVAGSFFTGLLAVLVATPCTAPFMGVAIAAGLAAPPAITMLVFAVMGLGLAAPYVVLSSMPGLGRLMPRPGRWMEVFKQALAFPMYAATAWLVWVLSQEAGSSGVLAAVIGLVLVGFAGWVYGLTQASALWPRRFGQAMAAVAVLAALGVLSGITAAPVAAMAESSAEAFTPQRLAELRAAGKPVFVNMTAAWCVTCLVNERVAISTDSVRKAFATGGVAYLKGDWTRQDPAITAFLQQNGRDGVPLYVFYPAGGGRPEVLPQILTATALLRLLRTS